MIVEFKNTLLSEEHLLIIVDSSNLNKKNELKDLSVDVGLVAIETIIPHFGGIITRAIDRKQNQYEMARIEQFTASLSKRVSGLESKLSQYAQDYAFNELMYDIANHVKTLRGENIIDAHAGLFASALESGNTMDSEFALKILMGFTEHHLAVLYFMNSTDYSNAKSVKHSSKEKILEPLNVYLEFPIFSFTKQLPVVASSWTLPSGEHEYDTSVIDATTIDYPSPILEKIANDLKNMGLATSPLYHSFQSDPNASLYLCMTELGRWLVQISKHES